MTTNNAQQPAYPARGVDGIPFRNTDPIDGFALGLTKLEAFAMALAPAVLAEQVSYCETHGYSPEWRQDFAINCHKAAQALLTELEKHQ